MSVITDFLLLGQKTLDFYFLLNAETMERFTTFERRGGQSLINEFQSRNYWALNDIGKVGWQTKQSKKGQCLPLSLNLPELFVR